MLIQDVYLKLIEKVNKNDVNENYSMDEARFIQLINEAQNKYVEHLLQKRNEDDIRIIQKLLTKGKQLKKKSIVENHSDFELPDNYFSFVNMQVFANDSKCSKNTKLQVFEAKNEDIEELLADQFNKPSFKYRESFYTISNSNVNVYFDNFEVKDVLLTYYRYPVQMDIEGYVKSDNTISKNINPEFDDKVVDRIISIAAKDFNINVDNPNRYQQDMQRIINEI